MKLSEMLKNYRSENKISQRELARRCGLSNSLISLMEMGVNPQTGKEMSPDLETYKRLADGMQISVQTLFNRLGNDATVKLSVPQENRATADGEKKLVIKGFSPKATRLYATDAMPRRADLSGVYGTARTTEAIKGTLIPGAVVTGVEEDPELRVLLRMWKKSTPERRKKIVRIIKELYSEDD